MCNVKPTDIAIKVDYNPDDTLLLAFQYFHWLLPKMSYYQYKCNSLGDLHINQLAVGFQYTLIIHSYHYCEMSKKWTVLIGITCLSF